MNFEDFWFCAHCEKS